MQTILLSIWMKHSIKQRRRCDSQSMDKDVEVNVKLTTHEIQFIYDVLNRRKMYSNMELPLGNPWLPWMQHTINRLKPYCTRTYD